MNPIVEQARTYLRTPYRHRGRSRKGIDCAGLPWCVYKDLGLTMPDLKDYGRTPHKNGLMNAMELALGKPIWTGAIKQFVPREMLQPGDVVVIRYELEPHHLGIIAHDPMYGLSLIHANGRKTVSRVVENGLPKGGYYETLICAVFRRPV